MSTIDPMKDGISSIERLPIAPSDLTVVNAARVSMHKFHTEVDEEKDPKLINYLASHSHWTPFSHAQYMLEVQMDTADFAEWVIHTADDQFERVIADIEEDVVRFFERGSIYAFLKNGIVTEQMKEKNPLACQAYGMLDKEVDDSLIEDVTRYLSDLDSDWWSQFGTDDADKLQVASFRIKMPIYIARQWYKHQIGFTRNEVSRRYVCEAPQFHVPTEWRLRADNVKQGSSDKVHTETDEITEEIRGLVEGIGDDLYVDMIDSAGLCPEQTRSILPQSMYTEFVETASMRGYKRLIGLRTDPHAQKEVRDYAENIRFLLDNG